MVQKTKKKTRCKECKECRCKPCKCLKGLWKTKTTKKTKKTKTTKRNRKKNRTRMGSRRLSHRRRSRRRSITKRMKGGVDPEPSVSGYCLKAKETFNHSWLPDSISWPKRFIAIEGNSLNVYDNHNSTVARGSSIGDLTDADTDHRVITRGGTRYHLLGITKYDKIVRLLFTYADEEDRPAEHSPHINHNKIILGKRKMEQFKGAIDNIAQGREWNVSEEVEGAKVEQERVEAEASALAIDQGYESLDEKEKWEDVHSHKNILNEVSSLEMRQLHWEFTTFDQFSEDFMEKRYDVYNKPELDYKSLLELFEPCSKMQRGGESVLLFTKFKQSSKLETLKQYLNLHENDVVLLYNDDGRTQRPFPKSEISKLNAVSSLMFPGYVRHLGCISAPQPFILDNVHGLPMIYEILAAEGQESSETEAWENILDKSTLQWFQTIVFRSYVYNCGIVRQEDQARNWTIYEPNVGDLYVFILKSNDKCLSYMCRVQFGDKFVKAIDIDYHNPGLKEFSQVVKQAWTGKLLERLGAKDSHDTLLPISKQVYQKGTTFELYCKGLEEVFSMAKAESLSKGNQVDGSESLSQGVAIHTYVLDADLLFNGKTNAPFTTFYSPDYTEEELQLLIEYKPFIQILMILNRYTVVIDWNDPGLQVLINLLPGEIKDQISDMLTSNIFDYNSIELPEFIKNYINECYGTSQFKS